MIQNDEEKEWMLPLLELRNKLDEKDDRHLRDFRRMNGLVQLFHERPIPGPYTQGSREHWLREVLKAQRWVRENGPPHVRDIELITAAEIQEIRRIWVVEKHEMEDSLPRIYQEATGEPYRGAAIDDNPVFGAEEMQLLRDACDGDPIRFELARELLGVERRHRSMARRAGLYDALDDAFQRGFYTSEEDAVEFALSKHGQLEAIEKVRAEKDPFAPLPAPLLAQLPLLDSAGAPAPGTTKRAQAKRR
jgi:DNA sulfur modification protein DndC